MARITRGDHSPAAGGFASSARPAIATPRGSGPVIKLGSGRTPGAGSMCAGANSRVSTPLRIASRSILGDTQVDGQTCASWVAYMLQGRGEVPPHWG